MAPSKTEVRRHLDAVLGSRGFAHAERLRAFLRYVVEEALAGRREEIKEYTIGLHVAGRPDSFDPKIDPIVRVDANRLRTRLASYYESEGREEPIRIELPKGSYIPAFVPAGCLHAAQDVSLAVLPFVNLSGKDSHFADGLTEELIHSLARLPGIRVIARSSAFQFQGTAVDAREAGRHLQVDNILEGSVRVDGTRLRVTAQLVDVRRGTLLWSEKYERTWSDIFGIQDEIAASITDALRLTLSSGSAPGLFARTTTDPDAYVEYLRGRHFWNQRTPDSLRTSLDCYEKALERDPSFAAASAAIAETLMVMALNDQAPTMSLMPRARAAARHALELHPGLSEALVSYGCVRSIFDWDWDGAAQDFESAIRKQPGSATAHYLYAVVNLGPRGLFDKALEHLDQALRLDPVSPVLWRDFGLIHFLRRDFDQAEAAWQEAEGIAPGFRGALFWRARLQIAAGRYREGLENLEARQSGAAANTRVLATTGYAASRAGNILRGREILQSLTNSATPVPPLDLAIIHLGFGEIDEALGFLETACEQRAAALYQFAVDPLYDDVRDHPRGEAIRLAMGLPRIAPR